jgi:hypothetical protein
MSGLRINVSLTPAQADALLFACSNALEEPANFERGSGNESCEGPLRRAHEKIADAIAKAEGL